jgi:hypothetical protein
VVAQFCLGHLGAWWHQCLREKGEFADDVFVVAAYNPLKDMVCSVRSHGLRDLWDDMREAILSARQRHLRNDNAADSRRRCTTA